MTITPDAALKHKTRQRMTRMTKLKDEAVGKIKQVVAETISDEKRRKENTEQTDKAKEEPNGLNPFDDLAA
jgi:hypothetical protein